MSEDRERFRTENAVWRQDHAEWLDESSLWLHQTNRLVAILHLLEHTLPDHSARLDRHIAEIENHDQLISRYECGLDERCLKTCDMHVSMDEQKLAHIKLEQQHRKMIQQHDSFRKRYQQDMQQFRKLANQLIDELKLLD